jgi:hypothetical protein
MTTQNTMGSLETWVRQLNGELNVSDFSRPKEKIVSEYVKEFNVALNVDNKCQWILTNGVSTVKTKPNVRFTFDGKNKELINVEIIKGGYRD